MTQLEEMTKEIVETFAHYEQQGTKPWTADVAVQDLQYQIGNLTKALLQLRGFRYAEGSDENTLKKKVADELADILAEVLFVAHEMDIDIEEAWKKMIVSDQEKKAHRSKSI